MSIKRMIQATRKPRKLARLVGYKFRGMSGSLEFTPFIVLTRARTGSNLLVSMLDSHPNIRAEGELFRDLTAGFHRAALDLVFAKQPRQIKASGFKIFYRHTLKDGSDGIWSELEGMKNLAVIHLKRRNILRTLVSRKIAGSQGLWIAGGGEAGQLEKRVSFSPDELRSGFEYIRKQETLGDQRFRHHPMITIWYEDLVQDSQETFRSLTDFLDVEYRAPTTSLRKQNPERLDELVANFEELRAAFSGTEWEPLFDELAHESGEASFLPEPIGE